MGIRISQPECRIERRAHYRAHYRELVFDPQSFIGRRSPYRAI
jgi:hypothetical protein